MITAWRLCRDVFKDSAFDGDGARRYGGRWNPPGYPVVYTSGSLALAALEILVHVDLDLAPDNFVSFPVVLPDNLASEKISEPELPGDWQSEYPPVELLSIGAQWIKRKASAVLRVPSTVVPSEHNFLLNPLHADFAKIEIGKSRPFHFDRRLWRV